MINRQERAIFGNDLVEPLHLKLIKGALEILIDILIVPREF